MYNHPNNYLHAIAARAHATAARMGGVLKEASDGPARLGAPDTYKHFRGITQAELQSGRFTRPITVTDIETGHNDQPISVAALKGVIDKQTGEFRVLDTYERYYIPEKTYSQSFNMAREVHKLTRDKIELLRTMQQASYGTKYDPQEASDLLKFMKGSLVVGHNVEEFDFTRLGIAQALQKEDILDTLVWAENAGVPRGKRGLSKLFKHYTGRSLTKAGYSHHFGFHDVLSNAELLSALYMNKSVAGRDLRFVTGHQGFSYGAYEGAAGTAIIKGGYYQGRGPRGLEHYMYEDEFDEYGKPRTTDRGSLEWEYDESGRRILPEGFSTTGEWDDPEELGLGAGNIFRLEANNTFRALREELQRVREATLGYSVAQRHMLTRYLANKDPEMAEKYLRGLKYNDKQVEEMMRQTTPLRIAAERKAAERRSLAAAASRGKASDLIGHMYRSGDIGKTDYQWLMDINDDSSGYSPRELVYRAKEMASERASRLKEIREQRSFEEGKEHKIDRYGKYHYLSKADEAVLRAAKNWEELSDAIEDVTKKNESLMKVYHAMANIKPYDVNQYITSAKRQWGGTMSASQGVVPNFIRNPVGRLGDAFFNLVDRSVAPWNAFNRTWNSGIGQAVTAAGGAIGGIPGMMIGGAISGTVNAASQIYGNYKQAGMEMRMLNIQNNLNTLGAMISWISTPFQLLHKAIKLVTGAFGGLTFKLNNIMGSGIGMMSQMGNPLEPLTGVNYVDYQRAGLVDMASLLKGGSTNTAIEGFAKMQRDLYRFGRVDTNKMLAANMLGVFNEAFTPTTDAEGSYYNMANKILRNMQGQNESQRADTMYYVTQLNDTLAQTIRSALMLGVTDVRDLTSPGDMYWRPLTTGEEKGFRRTQREYGIATQQFGFSKMRFADRLWNVVGRDLYNGFNELIDKLGEGNWRGAIDSAIAMWSDLKSRFSKIWEGDENGGGLKDKLGKGLDNAWDKVKEWGWKIANGIIDIWDQIFLAIVKKAQGLIAYLSTVQVGLEKDENGNWGINLKSIGSVGALDRYRSLYDVTGVNSETGETYTQLGANMSELDKFAMKYVPNYANKKALGIPVTPEDLAQAAMAASIGTGEGITLEDYGLTNFKVHNRTEAYDLLQMLYEGGSGGTGYRRQASLWRATERIRNAADPSAYNLPIMDTVEKLINEEQDIRNTLGQHYLGEKSEATLKLELFSEGEKKGSVKYEGGRITYEGMSPLSSVGLGKGISVKVAQQQGG